MLPVVESILWNHKSGPTIVGNPANFPYAVFCIRTFNFVSVVATLFSSVVAKERQENREIIE